MASKNAPLRRLLPLLHYHGKDRAGQRTREWFDLYDGPIGYDVRDPDITAEGDVGFCSFAYHVTGTTASGDEVSMWVRTTMGCRRIEGRWVIAYEHGSVPSDTETMRAQTGLEP